MRDDQYKTLQDLSTKLADVVIFDADPDNWVGAMRPAKDLTRDERGDAYWCRRIATSSLSVLMRVQSAIGIVQHQAKNGLNPVDVPDVEDDLDKEVAAAEKEAARFLKTLTNREELKDKFVASASGKT